MSVVIQSQAARSFRVKPAIHVWLVQRTMNDDAAHNYATRKAVRAVAYGNTS
jgi:hypothetical protein